MINNLYIKATPAAASITWGSITGTLSSQTDLQNALDAKFDDPTGTVSQYVRGDGSLANFPASTGGGGSLSFYLNGSVSQGTFGGVAFREMDRTPIIGGGTDFTIATNGYIQSFITDANVPNLLEIPAGNWNFETYFSASSSGGTPSFYIELYKWNGTTLSLIASNSATPEGITNGTVTDLYVSAIAVPQTTLALTDRLAVRIYVNNSGRTIKLHTENSHLGQVITTFSTGLTALNGLTAQVQNFATGTTGTDFGISSATSTHTFNLPTASAANRGALSSTDWTTFNGKQAELVSGTNIKTINGSSVLGSGDLVVAGGVTSVTGTAPVVSSGGATPAISMAAATTSVNGYLTSTNFNTFNNKQAALVSGTNIKTVNSTTLLGSGDVAVQPTLVSGTNIKTINSTSLLGSGDIVVGGRSGVEVYQAPTIINTYKAAAGTGITFLFGSPYPLVQTASSTTGNIMKASAIFQATQGTSNTRFRFYASPSSVSLSGALAMGFFDITPVNFAAGLDSICVEKTFILTRNAVASYVLMALDPFDNSNDLSLRTFSTVATLNNPLGFPYLCIGINQSGILHSVTVNYSR